MSQSPLDVVILISGRGSNMQAIVQQARAGKLPIRVRAVISNRPDAAGLAYAREHDIPTYAVKQCDYSVRQDHELAMMAKIDQYHPQLVVLAGYMRILGDAFVDHYQGRMMNIHPSLLPAYPGLHTHASALADNASEHGASVHFVTRALDGGPIIIQATVPVLPGDTEDTLAARVLEQEHRIYPQAIAWFAAGRLTINNNMVLLDGAARPEQGLTHPSHTAPSADRPNHP